ncbi:MAG: VOC family protein [Alphaproteobacteria bacterium]|nr:VOC family protein [Alphaproteobacteria bacterium]
MSHHRGRLIDHVHLRSGNLPAAKRFYRACFAALGIPFRDEAGHLAADEFWLDAGDTPSRIHLAFQTPDRATVRNWYEAVLAAGGRDNGPPGERGYHPGYYGAFVLDPDGNNIEAVHHGPFTRSSASVVIDPA